MKKPTKTANQTLQPRTKYVPTLVGHSDSKERLVSSSDADAERLLSKIEALKRYGMNVYVCASLQLRSASRISEILNVNWFDIDILGRIIIRGSKRSNDKVLDTGEFKEWFMKFRANQVQPFEGLNRQYIYRCYNNVGISYEIDGLLTKKVTHALRYEGLQLLSPTGTEMEAKQQLIGHKARKNTGTYDKKTLH